MWHHTQLAQTQWYLGHDWLNRHLHSPCQTKHWCNKQQPTATIPINFSRRNIAKCKTLLQWHLLILPPQRCQRQTKTQANQNPYSHMKDHCTTCCLTMERQIHVTPSSVQFCSRRAQWYGFHYKKHADIHQKIHRSKTTKQPITNKSHNLCKTTIKEMTALEVRHIYSHTWMTFLQQLHTTKSNSFAMRSIN